MGLRMTAQLITLLRDSVAAAPSDPFLTDLRTERTWTYHDLWLGTCHQAALLTRNGVGPGDRVALLTKNDPVFFPVLFACAMTGSILVPINRDNLPAEIDAVLDDAKPVLVLHDEYTKSAHRTSIAVSWQTHNAPAASPPLDNPPDDVLIIYTSGTTGNAKGVTLTQGNLAAMAKRFVGFYHIRPRQRFLSMLPFYHINAPMITGLVCLAAQAQVYLTDPYGFTNARSIFDMVEANGINILSLTPSIMASLLQVHAQGSIGRLPSLEFCFCGTAPLGESLWRQFETLAGVPVYQGYGLTETTTWATMTPPDGRKRYNTAGIPVGCEVRIVGDQSGEVLIKGDIVMSGYHNKKKLTQKSLQEGWYRSGDVGYLDHEGQLVIIGRTKNIIKRNGVLVHPEVIDECLQRHESVIECCTVGVTDPMLGERVIAACALLHGTTADLRPHVVAQLSPYMRPDAIVAIHAIPRNPVGKALADKVRDMVSGDAAERVIQSFTRSKISRAPSEQLGEIRKLIQTAILAGTTIPFNGFWGVGHRTEVAEPDRRAIARLCDTRNDMNAALGRKQVRITLLLADVHGRCNRIPNDNIDRYFKEIAALAAENGLQTRRTSALWDAAGLRETDVEAMASDPATIAAWNAFTLKDDFLNQAENRCAGPEQAEEFAYRYYCTCLAERPVMTEALTDAIFFTYNAPKFRPIMPELPTVHWHSTKPGTTVKPWFM
jgi:long-chain acyl-CoA synthetase